MNRELENVLDKIEKKYSPVSIFIYGSRGRGDFKDDSDYEIGVLYKNEEISRAELNKLHDLPGVNFYPFDYNNFINYKLDTPFPEKIYLRELFEGAKTLRGKKVVEKTNSPNISLQDLLERINFDLGQALGAVLSYRQGDTKTASLEFSKSCLFGLRCLIIFKEGKFPLTYDEIVEDANSLDLEDDDVNLISHAFDVRKKANINEEFLYKNIKFLNQVVRDSIKKELDDGNRVLL